MFRTYLFAPIALLFAVVFSGCTTIYFTRDAAVAPAPTKYYEWHNIGFFHLAEFAPPLDLQRACKGGFMSVVKVEQSFGQAVLDVATAGIYSPWSIEYKCK